MTLTNPYPIVDDININNVKGIKTRENENITFLKESMKILTVDNNKSIFVPQSKVSDEQTARYYATQARNRIVLEEEHKDKAFTFKKIKEDKTDRYLGIRIFRIN